jgi:hypothetical protein
LFPLLPEGILGLMAAAIPFEKAMANFGATAEIVENGGKLWWNFGMDLRGIEGWKGADELGVRESFFSSYS